jgi:SAM-dependent methyltransferase
MANESHPVVIPSTDVWAAGQAYEPYIGRWSRLVAREFIAWLDAPGHARWLDVGCGTGALTSTLLATAAPARICSIDRSSAYASFARSTVADARADFAVADAAELALASASIDVAVSGLVLNFVPEPARAVVEMARVVRRDGAVAVYVWDYAGEMELIRRFWDAACALDDRATALDEGRRFPVCHPRALEQLFRDAALEAIETRAIDVPTVFRDFSDYWTPFLGGQGPAPTYVASLAEPERARLRDRLDAELPRTRDGRIELIARAWAVRGTRT